MENLNSTQTQYHLDVVEDNERRLFYPRVRIVNHGVSREYVFGLDFFQSNEYARFTNFGSRISQMVKPDGKISRGEKEEPVSSLQEGLRWLQKEALRGQSKQRYKGLGEMNPDQLWKTTMDPRVRTMLRVTIEDAIAADHMFNTLMGDQVEPRKNFIMENALSVANLDV